MKLTRAVWRRLGRVVVACLTCTETDRAAPRARRLRQRAAALHLPHEPTAGAAPPAVMR